MALEAVRIADVAVEALRTFVNKAGVFLNPKYAELKEELIKIIELIKEWLGIEEEGAAKGLKAVDKTFEESKELTELEAKADESMVKDAEKDANDEIRKEEPASEGKEKEKVLIEAKVITKVAQEINLPLSTLMTELNLLHAKHPSVTFGSKPWGEPGIYEIRMFGSDFSVDREFKEIHVPYKRIDPKSSAGWKSINVEDSKHFFSGIVDNYMQQATKFTITGADKVNRFLYQLKGSLRGTDGIFEWIVEVNGDVTHRVFIPGGKVTGIPNKWK